MDGEYSQWVAALQSSTVHNFKEHPMVKRMLGDFEWPREFRADLSFDDHKLLEQIDNIGRYAYQEISGVCWRMIYYANMVLKREPMSIIEIGGGAGQFFAVMRALGYQGNYYISDIPEVRAFQHRYLREVHHQTRLDFEQSLHYDFCVSFYALGEFHDELKTWYVSHVVNRCLHGFVIWNPHSGASPQIPFDCNVKDEYPLTAEGNKQLEW